MLGGVRFVFASRARWRDGLRVLHPLSGKIARSVTGVAHWHSHARRGLFFFLLFMPGGVANLYFSRACANIELAMLRLIYENYFAELERKRLHLSVVAHCHVLQLVHACDCLNADACQSVVSPHADLSERCRHKTNSKERSKRFERI